MKTIICILFVCVGSILNAQKPPLKATVNCATVVGIYEGDLTDIDGISLKYAQNLCDVYYKGKLYTGKVKICSKNKIYGVTNYENGRLKGEQYFYFENGNLSHYVVYGKDTTEGEWGLLTVDDSLNTTGKPKYREIIDCEGVLNGEEVYYYENGKIRWKGTNLNGKRDGKWYYYDPNGAVM